MHLQLVLNVNMVSEINFNYILESNLCLAIFIRLLKMIS